MIAQMARPAKAGTNVDAKREKPKSRAWDILRYTWATGRGAGKTLMGDCNTWAVHMICQDNSFRFFHYNHY